MHSFGGALVGGFFGGFARWVCGGAPALGFYFNKVHDGFVGVALRRGCSPVDLLRKYSSLNTFNTFNVRP